MNNVIVFGSMNMDLTIESARVPLQGETISGEGFFTNPGGKGANQAVAAAKSGASTFLIGSVGTDVFGDQLVAALAGYGVHCDGVRRSETETGVAFILRIDGDNRIVLSPGANGDLTPEDAEKALFALGKCGDVFLTQLECSEEATLAALVRAKKLGMYTVVNVAPPKDLPVSAWSNIDLVCVNETECEFITGSNPTDEGSLAEALEALVSLGPSTAVVTLGGRGSAALADGTHYRVPALKVDVCDTTAAGDTFIGVLAAGRVSGLSLEESMKWASSAAGITASREGAQQAIPTAIEVETYLKEVNNEQ